jgi:hypothetical protein
MEDTMAVSSVSFTYGNVSFAAEAENQEWLTTQIDKFLELVRALPASDVGKLNGKKMSPLFGDGEGFTTPLAAYLREREVGDNQVRRFLATADWLRQRGNEKLSTTAVAKALSDNQQSRLGNPSESLNKNVAKGFCEKTVDGFFITPDGLKSLGYD